VGVFNLQIWGGNSTCPENQLLGGPVGARRVKGSTLVAEAGPWDTT